MNKRVFVRIVILMLSLYLLWADDRGGASRWMSIVVGIAGIVAVIDSQIRDHKKSGAKSK
jgi:hypothetical protein